MTQASHGARPVPVRSGFMLRVFFVFLGLALLSGVISLGGKWAGRSIAMAGHTDDTTVHEIVIGNDVLAVPANAIRFEAARRSGVAARLDLYLRWPQMDGYSHEARDAFNHADGARNILFLTFDVPMMSRDMTGRFEPIYRALVEGPGRAGPAGLTVYPFTEKSGYVDEVLVVGDEGGNHPFVARCLAGDAARESLAPCERDIHIGDGLNLTYRMPAELAGSWREVDEAVREAAGRFLQTGK
ncbi:hypothetical protein FY036_16935 [Mesorhizobium microcysteis]|uniref:Uncharacterized protein n=2 Tax=Neoaquamicrobium microcysteis TaxID=2682781 RepID=A0A5D4GST0_9HYPH|nr:hypothetical protein FY036_16935 [Mesorhizobium microcysteis]